MLFFLCLCLHFKNYSQLCTKHIHRKSVIAAARSHQRKPAGVRMPWPLSLYHCVYVLIYMCNCLGTWFSTVWEITSFYTHTHKSLLHWIENNNKCWSPRNSGGGYAYLIRIKGALCTVHSFMFSISLSSYAYSGLWHPALKALLMMLVMERDKKN